MKTIGISVFLRKGKGSVMFLRYIKLGILCSLVLFSSLLSRSRHYKEQSGSQRQLCNYIDKSLSSTFNKMTKNFEQTMHKVEDRVSDQIDQLNQKINTLEKELARRDAQFVRDQERIQREVYSSLVKAKVREEVGRHLDVQKGRKATKLLTLAENDDDDDDDDV